MLYPALLFLISPLFGADADYSAMFGSDKLKAASAAYEKFGYVSPLVELAKTDAAARKKLDELVADLKSKSEKSSYARDRLANIYFLAGDRAQFEKVANPDFAEAVFSAPDKIYPKLDAAAYYAIFGNSPRDLYDVIYKLCNAGMGNFAVKLWESDAFFKSSNTWDAVNAYQCLIGNGYADIPKDKLIKFLQKNSGADDISSIAFLYAITLEDPKYSEEHAFAKKAMDSLPAARRASELRNAFMGLRMSKYAVEQTEKLYEVGNLHPYDRLNLITYWIFGTGERLTNRLPASFLANPNREKAVKLMEESLTQGDFNIREIYCWLIQYYALAGTPEKIAPQLEKLSSVLTDSYEIRSIATSLLAGTYGYPKDEKLAELFLSRLTENEKANAYLDIARNLKCDSNVSPKTAEKYLAMSAKMGNETAASKFAETLDYSAALAFFDSLDKPFAANAKGIYLAKNGDWQSALAMFKKSAESGNNYAKLILACCAYEGRGVPRDRDAARAEFSKLAESFFQPIFGVYNFNFNSAIKQVKELFGEKSEVSRAFIDACMNVSHVVSPAAYSKYILLRDFPEVGRESEILELAKHFESYRRENFYNGEFADKKASKVSRASDSFERALSLINTGGEENCKKAFEILEKTYIGSPYRNFWLAYCYRNGIGTKADPAEADRILASIDMYSTPDYGSYAIAPTLPENILKPLAERYISENKSAYRFFESASLYLNGTNGLAPDFVRAVELYEQAAALDGRFFKKLAEVYKNNWKLKDDKKYFENLNRYFDYCKKELSYVPRDAYFDLALCYLNGRGTERDGAKALEYFEKAAERPYSTKTVPAIEALAYCAEKGIGRPSDPAEAAKLRKKAEALMLAQTYPTGAKNAVAIANLYNKGGLEYNPERKLRWLEFSRKNFPSLSILREFYDFYTKNPKLRDWKKANEFLDEHAKYAPHSPWGLYRRGLSLVVGAGCGKDAKQGIALLAEAAERGRTEAVEFLAYVYEKGIGVPRDEKLAEKWLAELKKKVRAYRWLAAKYVDGTNFITDVDRAKLLLKLGADNGDFRSKFYFENFEKFVSDSQK